MFDRFSDNARKVMGYSRQEADRFNHDYIGTEHILLGLIDEWSGVAADVLKNLDVDPQQIRRKVEKLLSDGTTMVTMGQLPFTSASKKVLELALEEASNLGHNYIGTEHLLLGLIREEEGIAAQVLQNNKVRLEDVREEVLELLHAEVTPGEEVPKLLEADHAADQIRIMRKLRNVTKRLIQKKGREPTIEEIAAATDLSVEEPKRVHKISKHPISLDRPIGESDDSYFGDFIEDEQAESPVTAASHEMLKDKIEGVLQTLSFREREIIKLRYGIGDGYTYTLEEVGRIFKVTRERVRQIEAKAVRKLQHPVRARKLEGFLEGAGER